MVKIRYGNDIPISWKINRNDKAEDFTLVKSLRLLMTSISSSVEITDYVIDGNVIKWMFWGKDQKAPATYRFTLIENAGQEGMFTIDACNALALVGTSCAADDCDGPFEVSITSNINDKGVTCTSAITLPSNGLSAYDIAVLHGFKGTEEEWLASLKGEKGDAFTYDDFTQEEIADLKKPAVDAAKQATTAAEEARTAATAAGKATTAATDAAGAAIQAATDAAEAAEKATEAGTAATEAASNADEAATEATQAATDATEVNQSIQTAEQERVTAEQQRVSAEQTRQTEFAQIKQQAETAANNANTAAAAANEAAENIEQNLSEKQDKTDEGLETDAKTIVGGGK